jgi:hypothetical protein
MKWLEKRFIPRDELLNVLDQVSPQKKTSTELAEKVYEVRKISAGDEAVKPSARAVHAAAYRSLRIPGVTSEREFRDLKKGKRKPVIVYSKQPTILSPSK